MNRRAEKSPEHGPDVLTFPPVIFAGFFIIGYVTDRAMPVDVGIPTLRHVAGVVLIVAAVLLAGWAVAQFRRARTHIDVRKPARSLVTGGPYRFTRNPMYVAAALLYAGIAIAYGKVFILLSLAPCLAVIDVFIIRREERYLEAVFGEPYRAFRQRVRRWL